MVLGIIFMIGIICSLAWLMIKQAKLVTTILIGLYSLGVIMSMSPIFKSLGYINEMSSAAKFAPLVFTITIALMVCAVVFIVLEVLCIASVIKICQPSLDYNLKLKFPRKTFLVSVLISVITLIILIIASIVKVGFGKTIIGILYEMNVLLFVEYLCCVQVMVFGIAGLVLIKNEQNVKPDEASKTLSNLFFLSVISIVLLFFSSTPILFVASSSTLNGILCALACVAMTIFSFSCIIAIMIGGTKPEKVQKFLKQTFLAIALISIVITIDYLIVGAKNGAFISLAVLALAVLGFFLAKKSRIVNVQVKVKETKSVSINKLTAQIPNISSENIAKGAESLKQNTTVFYHKAATIYQSVFKRVKQILFSPQTAYLEIGQEDTPHSKTLTSYILPLLVIPVLFAFIGYGLVGYTIQGYHFSSVGMGFRMAIIQIVVLVGGIYLSALIINVLADNFGVTKNFSRVFSLVAYAYTPMFLAGIFHIHHALWWLVFLVGLYGLYLLLVGLKPILKPTEDKADTYSIVSLAVPVVGYIVLFQVAKTIIWPVFFFQ